MCKCTYVYVYKHIFEISKQFYLMATYLFGKKLSKVKYACIHVYICIYKILNIHIYVYIHIFKKWLFARYLLENF